MALDVTVAGKSSDSYASLAEANVYFQSVWNLAKANAWDLLEQPQKERALKSATNLLETLKVLDKEIGGAALVLPYALRDDTTYYNGQVMRFDGNQRLQFPRNLDVDPDTLAPFIPLAVKEALFEQAIYLTALNEDVLAAQLLGLNKQSVEAGVRVYESYSGDGTPFAPMAIALMKSYVRRTRRFERG